MPSPYDQPTEPCPYCRTPCDADWVDVGVGLVQCGPYHCQQCGASEIGPNDSERPLSDREKETGWYEPGADPGSSANVVGGKIVSHRVMRDAYQQAYWDDPQHIEEWWNDVRTP